MLDGAARLPDLFTECARLGMPALAMTDHGNVFGAYEFWKQARAHGINPIIGMEGYLAPGSRHERKRATLGGGLVSDTNPGEMYTHMTLLAETTQGMHNLFRLSSLASLEGFYYKPRMDRELLETHSKGIIATTGCPSGEVNRLLQRGRFDDACRAASDYRDIFGPDNFYCEIMDHGIEIERRVRDDLLRLADLLDLPLLATNDSHYVHATDAKAHDALLCVQTSKTLADPGRFKFEGTGYYLKSPTEMRALFAELPGACDNTLLIAERCHVEFTEGADLMPRFPVPTGHTEASYLLTEVERGLARRYPTGVPDGHRQRVNYELGLITRGGYCGYFLVTADLIRHAQSVGIRVGPGRGSVVGSLIAYALGITELDPITHRLLFERFLNPERPSMPDIDIDFDERRREEVTAYVTAKYGSDRVAQIITYTTIGAKAAIKDAAKVLYGQPGYALADRVSKTMPKAVMGKELPLAGVFDPDHKRHGEAAAVRALYGSDPQVREILDTARGLEGLTRQWGVHAAGVILSREPLLDVIPVHRRPSDGAVITQFDMRVCETLGLLKMDFLGLRNLTVIEDCLRDIARAGAPVPHLESLPLDDPGVYELLGRGDTLGVFQLDSSPIRDLLKRMRPTGFGDITAVLALYRPGPMGADAHNAYVDRKNGRQEIKPIHPELAGPLADILDETYGLIVYQEQVLAIAQRVAGYSLGKADLLRKAMGKKIREVLDREYEPFSTGMRENGYSPAAVKALWDILIPFSSYAFNRAHSAAYGLIAYWTAYLKVHHPREYMAALLTSVGDDKDRMAIYLTECRRMGIAVTSPDINTSEHDFTAVGGVIRFGLGAVRNVGDAAVAAIVDARPYTSFPHFLRTVRAGTCNRKALEALAQAGAFGSLGHSRRGLFEVAGSSVLATTREPKRRAEAGQRSLFDDDTTDALDTVIPQAEWPPQVVLARERDVLGLYVSGHPLDGIEHALTVQSTAGIAAILDGSISDGTEVVVGALVAEVTRKVTRNGEPWAIVALEDVTASMEALAFARTYLAVCGALAAGAVLLVSGRVVHREDRVSLVVSGVTVPELGERGPEPRTWTVRAADCTPEWAAGVGTVLARQPAGRGARVSVAGPARSWTLQVDQRTEGVIT